MPDARAPEQEVQDSLLEGLKDITSLASLRDVQARSPEHRRHLESVVLELRENPALGDQELSPQDAQLLVGAGLWALGRLEEALAHLGEASGGEAAYFAGRCYLEAGFHQRALEALERAARGKAAVKRLAALARAEALAKSGRPSEALTELRAIAREQGDDPEVHCLQGFCHDLLGRHDDALSAYEKALELHPEHPQATFRLAFNAALRGDEAMARERYEALASRDAAYVHALINLGVLYEDQREFEKAIQCYRRVLHIEPNHPRARLYLKDAHASLDMVYDEDRQRELERQSKLLSVPVSDFELSVRARNCLQHMNIYTLGDLVGHTEEELLAGKNFGETSLQEIKEMLAARGLRLGLTREEAPEAAGAEAEEAAAAPASLAGPVDEDVLHAPIADLDLSIRSRKCMERLGIHTLGDLAQHTADELLASRNFGRTSLVEVTEKLARHGLSLREPEPPAPEEEEEGPEMEEEPEDEAAEDEPEDEPGDNA